MADAEPKPLEAIEVKFVLVSSEGSDVADNEDDESDADYNWSTATMVQLHRAQQSIIGRADWFSVAGYNYNVYWGYNIHKLERDLVERDMIDLRYDSENHVIEYARRIARLLHDVVHLADYFFSDRPAGLPRPQAIKLAELNGQHNDCMYEVVSGSDMYQAIDAALATVDPDAIAKQDGAVCEVECVHLGQRFRILIE